MLAAAALAAAGRRTGRAGAGPFAAALVPPRPPPFRAATRLWAGGAEPKPRSKSRSEPKSKSKSEPKSKSQSQSSSPYQLVIVESPSKARTVQVILNRYAAERCLPHRFLVDSCRGHVRDLPRSSAEQASHLEELRLELEVEEKEEQEEEEEEEEGRRRRRRREQQLAKPGILGVHVDDGYRPVYVVGPERRTTVERLRELASRDGGCVGVILATDEDREGEAIAWHLSEVLRDGGMGGKGMDDDDGGGGIAPTAGRVTFNEITEGAIRRAFFGGGDGDGDGDGGGGGGTAGGSSPRSGAHGIDLNLVEAQETRRVLDRLAGYTVSPLLWRKVAPGLSAGRVQSVGLRLVVERERERMRFVPSEYWDGRAELSAGADAGGGGGGGGGAGAGPAFNATLVAVGGVRVAVGRDFDGETGELVQASGDGAVCHLGEDRARELFASLADPGATFHVATVESRTRTSSAPVPFITSTLQQEGNRRLGLSVTDAMRAAQILYEAGFISYMRTDSMHLSEDALDAGRRSVEAGYGPEHLSDECPNERSARKKKRTKKATANAQEAHEAIRPSIQDGRFVPPEELPAAHREKSGGGKLPDSALRVYDLIYRRTAAAFMRVQVLNQTSVTIDAAGGGEEATFRASGSVVVYGGYALAWGGAGGRAKGTPDVLPSMEEGQPLSCADLEAIEHSTKPPPRYNEATFVKELEALGVGRPSTYAAVIQTLRQRAYVGTPLKADENARASSKVQATGSAKIAQRAAGGDEFIGSGRGPLCPSLSAFVVCTLLERHFLSYVDPEFTASMEDKLDQIASGASADVTRESYLEEYYGGDDGLAAQVKRIDESLDAAVARRADLPSLRSSGGEEADVGLFIGPWGPYVQRLGPASAEGKQPTANLPLGLAADISAITPGVLNALLSARENDGILVGPHPEDGRSIRLKVGRYGAYLQWGDHGEEGTSTHSLPRDIGGTGGRNLDLSSGHDTLGITLDDAVGYVGLPRTVGTFQDLPIVANIGPYGPYLKYNSTFVSLQKGDGDVLTVDQETAERVVTEGIVNRASKLGQGVLAELGAKEGSKVVVKEGRFGMYVNWKRVNAKMPPEYHDSPADLPLEEAWSLIEAKAAKTGGKAGKKKKKTTTATNKKTAAAVRSVDLPPAPKRPLSAYLHFCAERRPEIAARGGTLGEVSKELARQWAETDPECGDGSLRAKYAALAAEGRADYLRRKAEWEAECTAVLKEAGLSSSKRGRKEAVAAAQGGGRKRRAGSAPRAKTAYMLFCMDNRKNVATDDGSKPSFGETTKLLAKMWKSCDAETRSAYDERAAAEKEKLVANKT